MKEKIISDYGRVLRKGSIKSIVDLSQSLKIDFNFQIHNINDLVTEFNGVMPPNRISHYILAYIKTGSGKKTIGNYSFEIQPGSGLIFPKNVIHSTNRWSLDTSGFMLSFDDSVFEDYQFPKSFLQLNKLFRLSVNPHRIFDTETSQIIESLFREIKKLKDSEDIQNKKLFILKLSELIIEYQKVYLKKDDLKQEKISLFDEFVELLEANYKKEKEVNFYAEKLSVHPNYLNKIVRDSSDYSTKEFIDLRIVQEAKYLLTATAIPLKEIAYDLGFQDYNYFSRFFKKSAGQTPKLYRIEK